MKNRNLKKWVVISNLVTLHFCESHALIIIRYAEVALGSGIVNAEVQCKDMGVPKSHPD
jgi:hypothetical protein